MPQSFAYPEEVDLWFPMRRGGNWETSRGNRNFRVIGRLRDGVTIEAAQAQMELIAQQIEEENPDDKRGWSVRLEWLHERLVGNPRAAMWILMGAVTLLLLTACANLSSLFLAKFVYILVSVFLVLVALAACAIPARHAVRIDPVRALKSE